MQDCYLYRLDGYFKYLILLFILITEHDESGNPCRLVCWNIAMRGSVGENIVHLCLLLNNPFHTELAQRIIAIFPKLALDIYLGDEYYGNRQAIICLRLL